MNPSAATFRGEEAALRHNQKEDANMTIRTLTAVLAGTALAMITLSTAVQAADLRMSWRGGDSRHVATQKALEACGAKHGHNDTGEFTGFDGYLEKLPKPMAVRSEADIVQDNWAWPPLFSKNGEAFR